MKLKYIVPNMAQTFGNLEFAGENDVEQQRVNGRFVPVTRSYNLYSDIQRADDIIVVLPAKTGEKRFKYEQKVKGLSLCEVDVHEVATGSENKTFIQNKTIILKLECTINNEFNKNH